MTRLLLVLPPALLLLSLAVASEETEDPRVARGRKLFFDTQGIEYPSCAQCHNLVPDEDEAEKAKYLGPGGTLWGSVRREGWRNLNTYADIGEALQPCARWWQKRKKGFDEEETAALVAFLKTQGGEGDPLPKRDVQKRPQMPESLDGGDVAKGALLTERHCGACHSDADDALSFELKPHRKGKDLVARKVRGYDAKRHFKPLDYTMSYYTNDRLTDEDLLHIVAYLGK